LDHSRQFQTVFDFLDPFHIPAIVLNQPDLFSHGDASHQSHFTFPAYNCHLLRIHERVGIQRQNNRLFQLVVIVFIQVSRSRFAP